VPFVAQLREYMNQHGTRRPYTKSAFQGKLRDMPVYDEWQALRNPRNSAAPPSTPANPTGAARTTAWQSSPGASSSTPGGAWSVLVRSHMHNTIFDDDSLAKAAAVSYSKGDAIDVCRWTQVIFTAGAGFTRGACWH
jgi:hypothetical protein